MARVESVYCQHGESRDCEDCDTARDLERSAGPVPAAPSKLERVEVDTFFIDPASPLVAVLVVAGDEVPAGLAGRKRRAVLTGRKRRAA